MREHNKTVLRRFKILNDKGPVSRVARQLDPESMRIWVTRAEIESVQRPVMTQVERTDLKELRKKVKEFRRTNDIL